MVQQLIERNVMPYFSKTYTNKNSKWYLIILLILTQLTFSGINSASRPIVSFPTELVFVNQIKDKRTASYRKRIASAFKPIISRLNPKVLSDQYSTSVIRKFQVLKASFYNRMLFVQSLFYFKHFPGVSSEIIFPC